MKKTLAILLALVMLFSLYACNNNDSQTTDPSDSSQSTTNGTENTTGNTEAPTDGTEGTQPPTDEQTTAPTDDSTTPPTQAPTEAPTTPPTTCSHSWKDATCTAPKTCSKCGATEGSATGHSWKDATCTAAKTCTKCGATEGSAAGHSWKDATCTAAKTCTKCGATEGNAAGHSWKDATCTAPKTCSKCGATEGSAAGHSYSNGACSVCGTADPGFKQLTDGAWMYKTEEGYFKILTFGAYGVSEEWNEDIGVLEKPLCTIDEFAVIVKEYKDILGEFWTDPFGWCSVCEIDGVPYVTGHVYELSSSYTVEGNTIVVESAGETYTLVRTDGDTLKITASTNQVSVGQEYHWVASGYKEVSDVGSYFK